MRTTKHCPYRYFSHALAMFAWQAFLPALPECCGAGERTSLPAPASPASLPPLVHEGEIDAPVTKVWWAFTTAEGLKAWMVPMAEFELAVGGKMRTNYKPDGKLGDATTIENTVLAFEPERMLAIRATKPPEDFPFKAAVANTWTVIYFEPLSTNRTRLRIVGLGYSADETSVRMREFFEKGNAWTLQALQKYFADGTSKVADSSARNNTHEDQLGSSEFQSYRAHIAAAAASLRLNESSAVRTWLESAPAKYRDWEWRYLNAARDLSSRTIRTNKNASTCIAMSPDGATFATGGADGAISIWRSSGGDAVRTISAHQGRVYGIAFSPDGAMIASSGEDKSCKVWTAETGELLSTFTEHTRAVAGVAFSPDGKLIASCAVHIPQTTPTLVVEGVVYIWDPRTGKREESGTRLTAGVKPLSSIAWSRDGKKLAVGSWGGIIHVWEMPAIVEPREFKLPDEGVYNAIDAIAISPDGQFIAAGSRDGAARVFNLESGELVASLRSHADGVTAVSFSPDSRLVATGGADDMIRLWSTQGWKSHGELRGNEADVRGLAWTPNGHLVFSAAEDGAVRIWNPHSAGLGALGMKHSDACYAVYFSPDGQRLYSCGYDGSIAIWNAANGKQIAHWKPHAESCNTISLAKDGRRLASCSWDKSVKIWNAETQAEIASLTLPDGIYHASLSPDGARIAVTQGKNAEIWDIASRLKVFTLEGHEKSIRSLAFSPSGKLIVTASLDRTLRVWDSENGSQRAEMLGHEDSIESVAFGPDDSWIVSGAADGSVRRWETATGKQTHVLHQGDGGWFRVAVSPDGKRVAVGGRTATLMDASGGGSLLELRPHRDGIWHLSFNADGTRLATCSWDATITILDARPIAEK